MITDTRLYGSVTILVVILLAIPLTHAGEQTLIVTTDTLGSHVSGTYRSEIEIGAPVIWLLEINTQTGPRFTTYTTPPIELDVSSITINGSAVGSARALTFTTDFSEPYHNITYTIDETINPERILTNGVRAEHEDNRTTLTFDLTTHKQVIILDDYEDVEERIVLSTPDGPIILASRPAAIARAAYMNTTLTFELVRDTTLTITHPGPEGFVPTVRGPITTYGEPFSQGSRYELTHGSYRSELVSDAVLTREEEMTSYEIPGGALTISGAHHASFTVDEYEELIITAQPNTTLMIQADSRIVSRAHRNARITPGALTLNEGVFPATLRNDVIELRLGIEALPSQCYSESDALICTKPPSEIGTRASTWHRIVTAPKPVRVPFESTINLELNGHPIDCESDPRCDPDERTIEVGSGSHTLSFDLPSPIAFSSSARGGERVVITSPYGYENVTVRSPLPYPTPTPDGFALYWIRSEGNTTREEPFAFEAYDTNADGWYDEIGWTVPSLSTQTFMIIPISRVLELIDGNITRDLTETLRFVDGITATISPEAELLVTFSERIGAGQDITLTGELSGSVLVYREGTLIMNETISGTRERLILPQGTQPNYDYTLRFTEPVVLDQIIDPELVSYYDPTADISAEWDCTGTSCGTGNYEVLNDGVRRPNTPTTSTDYISQRSNAGGTDEHSIDTINETNVTTITLWAYVATGSDHEMDIELLNDGTPVADTVVLPGSSASWVGVIWDVDDEIGTISGRFTSTKNGVGTPQLGFVYAWYAEVLYDDFTPPAIEFVAPTINDSQIRGLPHAEANVTASDNVSGLDTITIRLYNFTSGALITSTNSNVSPLYANFTGLADGFYALNATATDNAGNLNATETRNFTIDTAFPIVAFVNPTPADGSYLNATGIEANATAEDLTLVELRIDLYDDVGVLVQSENTTNSTLYVDFDLLDEGLYRINATATDGVGRVNTTETRTIVLDRTAPVISFEPPTPIDAAILNASTFEVNLSVVDENPDSSTLRIYQGTSLVQTHTGTASRIQSVTLPDGSYSYNATTTDLAGLTDATETRTITIDTTPPTITIASPLNATYLQNTVNVSFSASDETSGVDSLWYFNGTDIVEYTGTQTLTLPNAQYTFIFYANDSAGNIAMRERSFTVDTDAPDTDPPELFIESPIDAAYYNTSSVTVNYTAIDNVAVDQLWYFNGIENVTYTGPVTLTLADGAYTFILYANDTSDNIASETISFVVDTTPPILSYEEPTDNESVILARNYLMINVSVVEENLDTISVTLANESGVYLVNTSTSTPFFLNYTNLPDGTYTFNATAVDRAGFTDALPSRTLILDTQPPQIDFVDPTPEDGEKINTPFIETNLSVFDPTLENITVFLYEQGGALITQNSSTTSPFYQVFTGLSDGNYTINATAIDAAGLTNETETRTIMIDTTIPSVAFEDPTPNNNVRLNQTYIPVNISFSDNDLEIAVIELYDQSGLINESNATISPHFTNFTGLSDGIYFIRGVARDFAGNENVTRTRTIELRTVPIETSFTTYYDPIADNRTGWVCVGGGCSTGHYNVLNEGVREPNTPNTATFIRQTSGGAGVAEHNVGTITETGIEQMTLWVYASTGSNCQLGISFENDATQEESASIPTGTSAGWVSVTWSDPSDVGLVSAVFTTSKVGGGPDTNCVVYSWYVEVNFEDIEPPVMAYVPPTDDNVGTYARNHILVNVTAVDDLSGLDFITTSLYTAADAFVTSDTKIFSPSFTNFTGLPSGSYRFNATACDLAGNCASLATRFVTIDGIPPNVTFVAPTDNHTSVLSRDYIMANVTAVDDFAGVDDITIRLYNHTGGALIASESNPTSPFFFNFTSLSDGIYILNATASDELNNTAATERRRIEIDTTPPTITITSPLNQTYTGSEVDLTYTVFDIRLDSCSYSLDGEPFIELAGCTNTTLENLTTGSYELRVRANDTLGNTAVETVHFSMSAELPDLLIEAITFEEGVEGQTLEVNVSVRNNATVASGPANVSLLIERLEASTVFISEERASLPPLGPFNETTISFSWTAELGVYRFTATADPDDVVSEADETNNELSANYSISSYQIKYGTVDFRKFLSNAALDQYKNWSVDAPSGIIFYADADASFFPSNLAPLNGSGALELADTALGMTYFNDSLSRLWDPSQSGEADETATVRIAGSDVENVPIIPSTPGSVFITGIMWDTADGGAEFDGSQDLVFVTVINASTTGTYGTYDYEIAVPSRLKHQIAGTDLVSRLVQIE